MRRFINCEQRKRMDCANIWLRIPVLPLLLEMRLQTFIWKYGHILSLHTLELNLICGWHHRAIFSVMKYVYHQWSISYSMFRESRFSRRKILPYTKCKEYVFVNIFHILCLQINIEKYLCINNKCILWILFDDQTWIGLRLSNWAYPQLCIRSTIGYMIHPIVDIHNCVYDMSREPTRRSRRNKPAQLRKFCHATNPCLFVFAKRGGVWLRVDTA